MVTRSLVILYRDDTIIMKNAYRVEGFGMPVGNGVTNATHQACEAGRFTGLTRIPDCDKR